MRRSRVRVRVLTLALTAAVVVAGCVAGGTSPSTTTAPPATAACVAGDPLLQVDQIAGAVAAVEAERGGRQQYFEINATPLLVNLFVANDDATEATPYVFVNGALTADDALAGASGSTFDAAALDFDPARVTACVARELPDSAPTAFEVVGGPEGAVRYSVVVTSAVGGQLVIEVAADGTIINVDPV